MTKFFLKYQMGNYIHYNIKKDLISSIGTSDTFKEQIK
jgi:hypothetical protein